MVVALTQNCCFRDKSSFCTWLIHQVTEVTVKAARQIPSLSRQPVAPQIINEHLVFWNTVIAQSPSPASSWDRQGKAKGSGTVWTNRLSLDVIEWSLALGVESPCSKPWRRVEATGHSYCCFRDKSSFCTWLIHQVTEVTVKAARQIPSLSRQPVVLGGPAIIGWYLTTLAWSCCWHTGPVNWSINYL